MGETGEGSGYLTPELLAAMREYAERLWSKRIEDQLLYDRLIESGVPSRWEFPIDPPRNLTIFTLPNGEKVAFEHT